MTRIVVDAMGGDHAPQEIVKGAVKACKEASIPIQLVGQENLITKCLKDYNGLGLDIIVTNATEVVSMDESPGNAIRRKKDASINVAMNELKKGTSQGLITAGSTGATMVAALFAIGRLPGIDRPAIAVQLPTIDRPVTLIDGGANADCTPEMLYQFAKMGSVYLSVSEGYTNPRVGILNIGGEPGKGNALVLSAYKLLESDPSINFVGSIEGKELFLSATDIIVCDGFTGNVTLKVTEGVAKMISMMIKDGLRSNSMSKVGGLLVRPEFKKIEKRMEADEFGGALLLGVKGVVTIAHGASNALAIKNAISVAYNAVKSNVISKMSNLEAEYVK